MKRNIFKGMIATAVLALMSYGISKSVKDSNTELNELTIRNAEALANGESFTFNGQEWNSDSRWYNNIGGKWKPSLISCVTTLEYGLSFGVFSISRGTGYSGQMVECVYGDGNCWDGTYCLP